MSKPVLGIKKLHEDAVIPEYQTEGASGMDVRSVRDVLIHGGETVVIDTGLGLEIPEGYEIQVRPRSGMSLKTKLRIANSPGTVDVDFKGSVGIIVDNIGTTPVTVAKGDRIAQLVLAPVARAVVVEVSELSESARGSGAYGSTGKN